MTTLTRDALATPKPATSWLAVQFARIAGLFGAAGAAVPFHR
ncbi:hypothetical protein [Nocardia sp. NPDC051832]